MKYHLLSLKWSKGNHYVWWGPNNSGYTTDLEKAGVYTEEQINQKKHYYCNTSTLPVQVEVVNNSVQQRVSVADCDNYKLFGIGEHLKAAVEY
ncbi:hypothetical protein [Cytobacillus horneckiae]|uniref:Uncharacterized protein n=1 Tax=Cytobacillus horneckiae TaxID=549687 RepID=A0A2N0ZH12_9BACI|nr:hypothetical protein [Cytobacillus horneckiae]MED2940673.1 hypothetical protein [Cytobacillus horneckiae]PKG28795.1 hypothetical protein CWS20_11965 [Cytobacillus horneckiae]